ncbi:phage integrase central domain-containing protein [Morganella morganii]|uniref:phage integrase central domain-containing protein n=1 Tax=Morganella morganii TaxID=582 RepID=UPI003CC7E936
MTFESVFREWYEFKKEVWSAGYRKEMLSMFNDDVLPIIGGEDIASMDCKYTYGGSGRYN